MVAWLIIITCSADRKRKWKKGGEKSSCGSFLLCLLSGRPWIYKLYSNVNDVSMSSGEYEYRACSLWLVGHKPRLEPSALELCFSSRYITHYRNRVTRSHPMGNWYCTGLLFKCKFCSKGDHITGYWLQEKWRPVWGKMEVLKIYLKNPLSQYQRLKIHLWVFCVFFCLVMDYLRMSTFFGEYCKQICGNEESRLVCSCLAEETHFMKFLRQFLLLLEAL